MRLLVLPIICSGGIGDSLLVLSRIPISFLGSLGIRFRLYYPEGQGHPAVKILLPLFQNINYTEYTGDTPSEREKFIFKKMMSLSQRVPKFWRLPLVTPDLSPKKSGSGKSVLIQTHMDGHHGWKGATAKIWSLENWIALIQKLHEQGCVISILEWDKEAREAILSACPYVNEISGPTLDNLCRSFASYDLLISIDSWTKYPAEWYRLKQVIIVPSLANGYTSDFSTLSADWIARWWFHGLTNNPRVKIIGLERINGKYEWSLDSLSLLRVDDLQEAAVKLLHLTSN